MPAVAKKQTLKISNMQVKNLTQLAKNVAKVVYTIFSEASLALLIGIFSRK